jgi:Cation transporter/ATPase, N-terminus
MNPQNPPFWSLPADQVLQQLNSSANGLRDQEAKQRLIKYGNYLHFILLFAQESHL